MRQITAIILIALFTVTMIAICYTAGQPRQEPSPEAQMDTVKCHAGATKAFYMVTWAKPCSFDCDSLILCNWEEDFKKGNTAMPSYFYAPVVIVKVLDSFPTYTLWGTRIDTAPNVIYEYHDLFKKEMDDTLLIDHSRIPEDTIPEGQKDEINALNPRQVIFVHPSKKER